ncbi:hypothetical protein NQ176_g11295 [Zarea fungicola]|uniref:Uncharacterized protein n=1 Tax=Zarea fungicola TaxID=93591 RepID=A0ACC1MD46_9HYPO|nr:hypothetical protein NQ176_g11295 [Lecanicillium fungicola]
MAAYRGAPKTHSQKRGAQYRRAKALKKEADSNQEAAAKPKTLRHASAETNIATSSNSQKRKRGLEQEDSKKSAQKRSNPEPQRAKAKRTKTSHNKRRTTSTKALTPAANVETALNNSSPSEPVTVYVFGGGENGELGLGPKQTAATRPRKNPFLDPNQTSTLHVVAIACGGMHTVALTADNKIVTWGVNDNEALGRNTQWDGGLRDVDDESDDSESQLNPFESTPTAISSEHFSVGTQFVDVAAGDSCSLALTSTGLVYGWGTFRVR